MLKIDQTSSLTAQKWLNDTFDCPERSDFLEYRAIYQHVDVNTQVVNPYWHARINSGEIVASPYDVIYQERSMVSGSGFQTGIAFALPCKNNDPASTHAVGDLLPPYWYTTDPVLNPVASLSDSKALESFVRKARKQMTKLQTGVVAGELAETLRFLRSPARALIKGTTDLLDLYAKRAKRARSAKALRTMVSDTYLEYTYAVKPLINDIGSAVEAYNKIRSGRISSMTSVSGSSDDIIDSEVVIDTNGGFGRISVTGTSHRISRCSVRYFGLIKSAPTNLPGFHFERRALGLTVNDFIPTVWELIPYSFLIDYFSNVGDILSAASFDYRSMSLIGRSTKVEFVNRCTGHVNRWGDAPWAIITNSGGDPGSLTVRATRFTREIFDPNTFNAIPSFRFKIPGSKQLLNTAVLSDAFHRRSGEVKSIASRYGQPSAFWR